MSTINDDITVVIRSVDERTCKICRALVLKQIPERCIYVVNETPFEAALRSCYQIGIKSQTEWMITIDADVLLRDGAIDGILSEAKAMPSNYFQIEGMIFDKFTYRSRWAGYRCYRIKCLDIAYKLIPQDYKEIRPESAIRNRMADIGYPFLRSYRIYGIHDYEQYYIDIYRKAFIYACKHQQWLLDMILLWKKHDNSDNDYHIAMRGLCDGLLSKKDVKIDATYYREKALKTIEEIGLSEKNELPENSIQFKDVEDIIQQAVNSPDSIIHKPIPSKFMKLKKSYKEFGILRIIPHVIGSIMCDIGNKLKKL